MFKWMSACLSDDEGYPSSSRLQSFMALLMALVLATLAAFDYTVDLEFVIVLLGYSFGQKTFDKAISVFGKKNVHPEKVTE